MSFHFRRAFRSWRISSRCAHNGLSNAFTRSTSLFLEMYHFDTYHSGERKENLHHASLSNRESSNSFHNVPRVRCNVERCGHNDGRNVPQRSIGRFALTRVKGRRLPDYVDDLAPLIVRYSGLMVSD